MKIVLADCYHDSDKGGGGMVAGAVAAIREACGARGVRGDISLLYRFSEDDPKFAGAARLTAPRSPIARSVPRRFRAAGVRGLPG
jgi:hypothetical protein